MKAATLFFLALPMLANDNGGATIPTENPIIAPAPAPAQSSRRVYVEHKAAHALAGLAVYELGKAAGHPRTGLAIAFGLGIAKELYDRHHGGSFRAGDVAWTGGPATVAFSFKW